MFKEKNVSNNGDMLSLRAMTKFPVQKQQQQHTCTAAQT